ncbi:Creatinase/Aminopeptidase P/Spt16, N-terminal [Sesbania bispinosa]|nr:Creatinase/Aminopeptidase P/Spt16, N-terminal [Sesbania bispinosa]
MRLSLLAESLAENGEAEKVIAFGEAEKVAAFDAEEVDLTLHPKRKAEQELPLVEEGDGASCDHSFLNLFFLHQTGENSISKHEWKSSPDPFLFGSFELVQVQHQSPMAVSASSNDVAPAPNENHINQEGGERIWFLKDMCSPLCVLRPFDVMPERIEQKMVDSLPTLRSLMASHSPPLNALVVPCEDYHRSEYVSDRDKRHEFILTAPDEVAWLYNILEVVGSMLVKDYFGSVGCRFIVEEYLEGEKGDLRVGFTHGVMNMDGMSNLGRTILASGGTTPVPLFP